MDNFDFSDPQFKDNVQLVVKEYLKNEAFTDRKLTDTPTDDLQVVNKKYCDRNKITYSSVVGEYLNGNAQFALPQYVTGTAGEDLLTNDAVFISNFTGDNTILNTAATGADGVFGQATGTVRTAQTFSFPSSTQLISKITVRLLKTGTPADNVVITLRDGLDGTVLQTIATIAGGTITGTYADYSYTLTEFTCAKNTSYVIQMARSGSLDDVNYYRWQASTGSSYPNGFGAIYDGATWATNQADRQMILQMTTSSGNFYKCRTDIAGFYESDNGFVKTGVSKNATVTVNVGMQQTLSGLSGRFQYLTDSPGLISSTPGTNVKEVGVAFSATQLELSPMFLRNFKNGLSSINSSTTTNIAHGLPVKPRFVRITAIGLGIGSIQVNSTGVYNGTTISTIGWQLGVSTGPFTDSSNIISITVSNGNSLLATMTTDATNLIFVSTLSGTCTAYFMWEAFS